MSASRGLVVLLLLLSAVPFAWADAVWTGDMNTKWSEPSNWLGGAMPLGGEIATLTGAPTANQPDVNLWATVGTLNFESAGWTVTSAGGYGLSFNTVNAITSAGAGVNTVDVALSDSYVQGMTFQAGTDNTLVITRDFTQRRDYGTAGDGTIIFQGTGSSNQTWLLNAGTTLFNHPTQQNFDSGTTVAAGSTLGGAAPAFQISAYGTIALADGASLSPGGDGVYGDLISALRIKSASATTRAYADMGGTASSLVMDLGSTLGSNDQIIVDLSASNGYFYLRGCELALRGGAVLADGDYTILTEATGNYSGTFGTVTYNGAPVDPSQFQVTYNPDSVVVSVTGVPEPATAGLIALGALALAARRRR
ncbi:MAG: PEP-CTERM sorting domain-containing protein [Planctomycetes bacterium]|nr:PEP-CTERM sorting domain-containing protein [Planctomycetota bacterium]